MTGLKELKRESWQRHSAWGGRVNRAIKVILIVFFISIILINTASALNTYTSKDGYTIKYPLSWSVKDDVVQTFTSEKGDAWVIIASYSSAGMSSAQIVKDERDYLIEKERYPSDEKDVNINGLRGVEWKYVDYYEGAGYQNRRVLLLAGDKYYTINAESRVSNFPLYSNDFEQIINSFKTKGVPNPTPISTSSSSYHSLTLPQGEEYGDSMELNIDPGLGSSYAWADASGDAASWVTPRRLDFGLIEEGTSEVRYYTIKVPKNQKPGYYELIWTRGCKEVTGETCSWKVDKIVYQISVKEKPTPAYTPAPESSTASIKIGLGVILIIVALYIPFRAVKGAKKREEKPAPVFIPAPTPVPAYPAAPKKQEPVAEPQANELKEKLLKTNQLLDKLDERLVNGELTEAKYKELAGKYKAEADSLKNQIAEKELLDEVGFKKE